MQKFSGFFLGGEGGLDSWHFRLDALCPEILDTYFNSNKIYQSHTKLKGNFSETYFSLTLHDVFDEESSILSNTNIGIFL